VFLDTLDPPTRLVFQQLGREPLVSKSFLAGGSALALHFGHRISYDLDFFSRSTYSMPKLLARLESIGRLLIESQREDTLVGTLDEVRLIFFTYPYALLDRIETCEGIHLASTLDIALMKIAAVGQRGRKRDFIDLYFLCHRGFSLERLLREMPRKFPNIEYPSYHLLRALAYFDDAENDPLPKMLEPFKWEKAKQFFQSEAARLAYQL
jgi:Nucleotidyl transferase AbiEii toxin, Type IV TA system